MENFSDVTRPLQGPASLDFHYATFPALPARSSYLRVAPEYFHPLLSLSISQNTEPLP